jgi:hypothetical protein
LNKPARILNAISGNVFFLGFLSSQLRAIPVAVVSGIFALVSLIAFLVGYLAWYLAALCFPDYARQRHQWYGFFEYKKQNLVSAMIGMVATVLCLCCPALIFPAFILYTISNSLWVIAEYHYKNNPNPNDENFSSKRQADYLYYTLFITLGTILATAALAISIFCPLLAPAVYIASTVICTSLTLISFYFRGKSLLGKYKPDNIEGSYQKLAQGLPSSAEASNKPELEAPMTSQLWSEPQAAAVTDTPESTAPRMA